MMDFRPLLQVTVDGAPLSSVVFGCISAVRVTDEAGMTSDTAEITFSNTGLLSRFAMPEPGAEISIALGYLGQFRAMGIYVADEIEESAPPRQITMSCTAKAQGVTSGSGMAPIQQQKTRSWTDDLSLGDIVSTIASDNGLSPAVSYDAAAIVPGHVDQVDESDLSVLTRLAARFDLVAKPAGALLFVGRRGASLAAGGGAMPIVTLQQAGVSRWAMRRSQGEAAGTVIATWRDLENASDEEVSVGDGEPVRRLRQRFSSEDEATAAAQAEARRANRATEALEVDLPGNPQLVAEARVVPVDFSAAATGEWLVETAVHEVTRDGGYSTSITCERPE